MVDIGVTAEGLFQPPSNRPIRLLNRSCPYCGSMLDRQIRTKELVIGRKFVPVGSLNNQWNLIVWACGVCNNTKSQLEDDISAITMQPGVDGKFHNDDPRLQQDSVAKASKSISRATRRPIGQSRGRINLYGELAPGINATFNLISRQEIKTERVFRLAKFHAMPFFYLITFREEAKQGGLLPGTFMGINQAFVEDWGNSTMRSFMDITSRWEPRILCITADGFFKIGMRRKPGVDIWSFAVEWNKNLRVIAVFGANHEVSDFSSLIKKPSLHMLSECAGSWIGVREEIPLAEESDHLFSLSPSSPFPA